MALAMLQNSCGGGEARSERPRSDERPVWERHQVKIVWKENTFALEGVMVRAPDGSFALNALSPIGPPLFAACRDETGAFSGKNLTPVLEGKLNPQWVAYDNWRMFGDICKGATECRVDDPLLGPVIAKNVSSKEGMLERREFIVSVDPAILVTYSGFKIDRLGLYPSRISLVHQMHGYSIDVLVMERREASSEEISSLLKTCR